MIMNNIAASFAVYMGLPCPDPERTTRPIAIHHHRLQGRSYVFPLKIQVRQDYGILRDDGKL